VDLGLNQTDFWARVGGTQSGGSRYENYRKMPKAVQELLRVVYVERINLAHFSRQDLEVVAYLKKSTVALFARHRASAADGGQGAL
jgi:hypothetical protein